VERCEAVARNAPVFAFETHRGLQHGKDFLVRNRFVERVDTLGICANLQSVWTLLTSPDPCISRERIAADCAPPAGRRLGRNRSTPNRQPWITAHTMQTFKRFLSNEEGLETVEYGLVAALIVIVAIVAMKTIGPKLKSIYEQISAALG
jgi:Flp pilus assembly pilin Flp